MLKNCLTNIPTNISMWRFCVRVDTVLSNNTLVSSVSNGFLHCHTTSYSTTHRARRWFTADTLLYDLCRGRTIFILNDRSENKSNVSVSNVTRMSSCPTICNTVFSKRMTPASLKSSSVLLTVRPT